MHGKDQIRCTQCGKLVAKSLAPRNFEIKCTRCGTLNTIFEAMNEQVMITDSNSKILYVNEAVELASGICAEDIIGKNLYDLWEKQTPEALRKDMWSDVKHGKGAARISLINRAKTDKLYKVNLRISPIMDVADNVIFYVGIEEP